MRYSKEDGVVYSIGSDGIDRGGEFSLSAKEPSIPLLWLPEAKSGNPSEK